MTDGPSIEKEFDRVTRVLNTIYGRYITHIVYSAIGSGAVVGVFATLSKESGPGFYKPDVLFENPVIIILIFAVPILTISWGAGFVYLNAEMWAHRHYLASLERAQSQRSGGPRIGLYSTALWETLYEGGRSKAGFSSSDTTHLTRLTALFPATVGLVSMLLGMMYIYHRLNVPFTWFENLAWPVTVLYGIMVSSLYWWVFRLKGNINKRLQRILESDNSEESTDSKGAR